MILNGVEGYLIPGDVAYLEAQAARLPYGGILVEVGSWMGLSTSILAGALHKRNNHAALVYAVDTWRGSIEHQGLEPVIDGTLFSVFMGNMARLGFAEMVTPCIEGSPQAAARFAPGSVNMVFIDGDHTEGAVYADLCAWAPLLASGGVMFGHDATPTGGVLKALRRWCAEAGREYRVIPGTHYMWELCE